MHTSSCSPATNTLAGLSSDDARRLGRCKAPCSQLSPPASHGLRPHSARRVRSDRLGASVGDSIRPNAGFGAATETIPQPQDALSTWRSKGTASSKLRNSWSESHRTGTLSATRERAWWLAGTWRQSVQSRYGTPMKHKHSDLSCVGFLRHGVRLPRPLARATWTALSDPQIEAYVTVLPPEWSTGHGLPAFAVGRIKECRDRIDGCVTECRRVLNVGT